MSDTTIVPEVQRRMAELSVTQAEVARECGITQPHLSKVLSLKVNPGRKTRGALRVWLSSAAGVAADGDGSRLAEKVARLERLAPRKRIQIMHLLDTIEDILRA